MKLQLSFLTAVISLISISSGSTILPRQDGPSGDGDCDPCDETCAVFSKRDGSSGFKIPRMLEANETNLPWEADEGSRWIKPVGDSANNPQILTLAFNCANLPEICNNICYGFFCAGKALPNTLTINRASCAAARKANACGSSNPNYCSARRGFPAGYSCDEYPFASTNEGRTYSLAGRGATRCVPRGQNSAQGGFISGLYRNGQGAGRLADGTQFLVGLANTVGVGYCVSYPNAPTAAVCASRVGGGVSSGSQL